MANIEINELKPAGAELFSDSEGFMTELSDSELADINGGEAFKTRTHAYNCGGSVTDTWAQSCGGVFQADNGGGLLQADNGRAIAIGSLALNSAMLF